MNSSDKYDKTILEKEIKLVSIGSRPLDWKRFPDFFCIGPQRTGSTWLHTNLVKHPEILMHRDKETFFFSTLGRPDLPRFRYKCLDDYLASFKDCFFERLLKNYHSLRRRKRLYSPHIIGESTASYCVLQDSIINYITVLNPDLKVIVLLRDPLERAWSHAKKDLIRDTGRQASIEEFLQFCSSQEQLNRADYAGILARWQRHLKPGHCLITRGERITSDPEGLLRDVLTFLGAHDCRPPSLRHITTRQNPTAGLKIPHAVRAELELILRPHLEFYEELKNRIGDLMIV